MQHLDQAGRAKSLAVGYGSKSCVEWLKPSILFTGTPGQYSISPLNLEELREEKAVQFAAKVTNRFTALEAAQNNVTPDLWKSTETVLLEVAREMIGCIKSQKKKKWISDEIKQQSGKRGKQKAKMRINIKN